MKPFRLRTASEKRLDELCGVRATRALLRQSSVQPKPNWTYDPGFGLYYEPDDAFRDRLKRAMVPRGTL